MEYVLAVAELRSFSKAAQRLYVTQPSLSQYIIKTERRLGYTLFDRSVNPIELTKEGEIFVDYAKRFRRLEQNMSEEIKKLRVGKVVRIGTQRGILKNYFSDKLARLIADRPDITVQITEDSAQALADKLLSGSLDIILSRGEEMPEIKTVGSFSERLCLAVPRRTLADIAAGTVIDQIPSGLDMVCDRVSSDDTQLQLALVEAGAGAAVIPEAGSQRANADIYYLDPKAYPSEIKLMICKGEPSESVSYVCRAFLPCDQVDDKSR